jgi:hypothetical protein
MKGSIIHDLPRYDRYMGGKGGVAIGYPWLSIGAIVALETYICAPGVTRKESPEMAELRRPKRVLEFGSGGSTIFWAKRVEFVQSFELDPKWAPITLQALKDHGVADKVSLFSMTHSEALVAVSALPNESFDLMLVDHADPQLRRGRIINRLTLALCGLPKLKSTGWLVVDNYAMHGMENFDFTNWDIWHFDDMRYSGRGTLIAKRKQ